MINETLISTTSIIVPENVTLLAVDKAINNFVTAGLAVFSILIALVNYGIIRIETNTEAQQALAKLLIILGTSSVFTGVCFLIYQDYTGSYEVSSVQIVVLILSSFLITMSTLHNIRTGDKHG